MRSVTSLIVATVLALVLPGTSASAPPAPPNPSDEEIQSGRAESQSAAGRVGTLATHLAEAEGQLVNLNARVEVKMEDANKARVDLQRAQDDHAEALQIAESAAAESRAAADRIEDQRQRLDQFAAGSYRQGSALGSASAFVGADSPKEVLDRAEMLDAVSASQGEVLDGLHRARTHQANKDSVAREALQEAAAKRSAADDARATAEEAENAAVAAQSDQVAENARLESEKDRLNRELQQARSNVAGLEAQRGRYEDWLAAKEREEQAAAAAAAAAAEEQSSDSSGDSGSSSGSTGEVGAPAGDSVEVAVDRALSQLGVTYAWGGGNANGPTKGIRDGGVADSYGDYQKVGFDCSGLMIYAFAGVGVELAHYSGYQYDSGTKVPLSQMQRGDMLFWEDGGRTHHVAMYLGDGQMVEAPYSGSQVRVTSVRYSGIAPYAVRLL
ncbi:NlpC/P60 family protein [Allosaccharopolyspora coralli]|uniref:NlpC/P60 family protein n=1 Tax=Allosaccharopolyspora coralli TaxID=2665642 RepID=UPI0016520FBB|nr:NlpC/P60 family protein [Allosaccharopolyspora coralli]